MKKVSKNRIWELDALRGFSILVMLFDHATFDLAFLMPSIWVDKLAPGTLFYSLITFARSYWASDFRKYFVWPVFVTIFFLISGICTEFTKSSGKRALRLVGVALLITGATWLLDYVTQSNGFLISAGVIHTFAVCAVVHALTTAICGTSTVKLCKVSVPVKHFAYASIAVVGAVIALLAPSFAPSRSYLAFLFGLPATGFSSADYIPVLPWLCVFLLGALLSPLLYPRKQSHLPRLSKFGGLKPLCFVGKNSLWFYVAHQPVIYALITLLGLVCFGELRIF